MTTSYDAIAFLIVISIIGIILWTGFLTKNKKMGFGKELEIEIPEFENDTLQSNINNKPRIKSNNPYYGKLEDYKEKEYNKTEVDLKLESFFNKLGKVIWGILKVFASLILIGLIIWAIVAFPIATIIILLILILLK